jgi:hypothetical protein
MPLFEEFRFPFGRQPCTPLVIDGTGVRPGDGVPDGFVERAKSEAIGDGFGTTDSGET